MHLTIHITILNMTFIESQNESQTDLGWQGPEGSSSSKPSAMGRAHYYMLMWCFGIAGHPGGSCGGDVQVPFHVMFPMPIKAVTPRTHGCRQCCLPWQGGKGSSTGSLMQRIWAFGQTTDCSPCALGHSLGHPSASHLQLTSSHMASKYF